ncbi:MAG TPA: sigma factor-like helix-turn-helix DNA-binding protein [Solirubrobacteraceae bacterium]|nr:sigma factor-like helix-turn-helix DNA-binding protein [Solirubrobacteraceae bacterium]
MGRHDEERLRRFVGARRAGEEAGARRWWDELVTDNFDRVQAMVYLESRGRLSPEERDDALQRALIKLTVNMIDTFHGESMGEWVQSTRTLVKFACIDTQRRAQTVSQRERALDRAGRDGDDAVDRLDRDVYEALEQQRREAETLEQDADVLGERQAFLDWAVPRLSPKRRAVIELDRTGVPVEEIQERLGVSRDVVYQSRHRALQDLAKLREEYQR